jgi:hypothetical protein
MQRSHYLATAGLAVLIVLGGVLLARAHLSSRIRSLRSQVVQTATQLTTEPESIPHDAIAQRYRAKHEAINAMRGDLARLVAFESTYVANSGRLNLALSPFAFPVAPGSWLHVQQRPEGWNAEITSIYTPVRCTVSVQIEADSKTSIPDSVVCGTPHLPVP